MKLVAEKTFSYATRRLQVGDVFEAKDPDGRLLVAVRKARKLEDRPEAKIPSPKKELIDKLSTGGVTSTAIPTTFVGEKPTETIITPEQANQLRTDIAGGDVKVVVTSEDAKNTLTAEQEAKIKEDLEKASAKEKSKDENKPDPAAKEAKPAEKAKETNAPARGRPSQKN